MKSRFAIALCFIAATFAAETDTGVSMPVSLRNYDALFHYIARNELVTLGAVTSVTPHVVSKLAAESTVVIAQEGKQLFSVVVPHYYAAQSRVDLLRGASGNGSYYILRLSDQHGTDGPFELVGIASGNSYRWMSANGVLLFITRWHLSSSESPEVFYRWQSDVFRQVSKAPW